MAELPRRDRRVPSASTSTTTRATRWPTRWPRSTRGPCTCRARSTAGASAAATRTSASWCRTSASRWAARPAACANLQHAHLALAVRLGEGEHHPRQAPALRRRGGLLAQGRPARRRDRQGPAADGAHRRRAGGQRAAGAALGAGRQVHHGQEAGQVRQLRQVVGGGGAAPGAAEGPGGDRATSTRPRRPPSTSSSARRSACTSPCSSCRNYHLENYKSGGHAVQDGRADLRARGRGHR